MSRLAPLFRVTLLGAALLGALVLGACGDEDRDIILATTTSTENSGLLDVLVPLFEEEAGYEVSIIAVGSGAAMEMGRSGDADVLLVHSPDAEIQFVEDGAGITRTRVMYNDFVIVGPPDDPAGIEGLDDAAEAMRLIAEAEARFVSRGDDSGTHAKELSLWEASGADVPEGESWYGETGQGMGATLTIASEQGGYTIADRGTWLAAADPEQLPVLVEGDERLFNVYHVIPVNAEQHDHAINEEGAEAFRAFLVEPDVQQVIGEFGVEEYGMPLFVPHAE